MSALFRRQRRKKAFRLTDRIYRGIGHEVAAEGGRSPDAIEIFLIGNDFCSRVYNQVRSNAIRVTGVDPLAFFYEERR